ncbi:hypothetical protein BDFB_007940 [Asbolus verrucosus]|uniref:Mitochondrial transcription rescue factor 1 C-terminal domain-containing protein n=1 Tax=Asbolus verrucosus TaxID=1661398 RepID=A0A482V9T1_ASBVE|nr:hypothetical protein BDFB_007940 [Asbolus verrucosus]
MMLSILQRRLSRPLVKIVQNHITKGLYSNICCYQLPAPTTIEPQHNLQICRFKSKKSKKQTSQPAVSESESEEESAWDDLVTDKHSKVMQIPVKSMRIDGILKSSLGIARNKIETLFYESKIRVNGQKLLKKSELAQEGDEIDIVKGVDVNNSNFLTVARVEILAVSEKGDNLAVKVRRCKSLTVENYEENVKPSE